MEFAILGLRKQYKCNVKLVKADVIEIKRKPNQVFTFRDASNFVDSLVGHSSVVVYVGRRVDGESEDWVAYYWEPADPKKTGYGSYEYGILPLGSLAVLEMESEYDLQWELENRATECARWLSLIEEASRISQKIQRIDEENRFANTEQFHYMNADTLEKTLDEMKEEYARLSHREKAEVG